MGKIRNFEELAESGPRRAALTIAEAGLGAIDTAGVIRRTVRADGARLMIGGEAFDLGTTGKLVVNGIGKCALEAATALEEILGDRIDRGVALHIGGGARLKKIKAFRGTHPLPSGANVRGASALVETLKNLEERDLVIFAVSGGGSTLLCLPEDAGCDEEASILAALMRAGARIQETNTVRKHLSLARGGYLAQYAYPARVVSLIFSDVPGNDIQFVASGPTVKDTTTIEEAEAILATYDVLKTCGMERCGFVETPKEDKYFRRVTNLIAVSNRTALTAMAAKARALGFVPEVCDDCLAGEAREVGQKILRAVRAKPSKSVLLYGGETTVTVRVRGRGGRNLELALSALAGIREDELILSLASDGRDNGEFAGAICDTITRRAADAAGAGPDAALQSNDTYPFFERVGHALVTGDTGSNVSDLIIAVKT